MSIASDKNNVANSLSVITSVSSSLSINNNQNASDLNVNNFNNSSKDPIVFILDLFVVLIGVEVLKGLLSNVLNNFIPNIEPQIKNSLKTSLLNEDNTKSINGNFIVNGYNFPLKQLDYNKKFKGGSVNERTITPNSLDSSMFAAVNNPGSIQTFKNLNMVYDPLTDNMNFKPVNSNTTSNNFLNGLIDGITFVNKNLIITLIIDYIFGTLQKSLNKTRNQMINDEQYNQIIQKLIDDDTQSDEQVFSISPNDLNLVENKINNKINGILPLDYDCGTVNTEFTVYTIDNINNSNDPITALDNEIDNILPSDPNQTNRDDLAPNRLNNINQNIPNNNKFNNKSSVKNKLYKDFMNGITVILLKNTTLSPQALVIQGIAKNFAGNNSPIGSDLNLIKNQKNTIKCMVKTLKSELTTFLYALLKKEIVKIIKPFALAILNEKLNDYSGILKSLTKII